MSVVLLDQTHLLCLFFLFFKKFFMTEIKLSNRTAQQSLKIALKIDNLQLPIVNSYMVSVCHQVSDVLHNLQEYWIKNLRD